MNTYQHSNDMSYNNGIRPVFPSASASASSSSTYEYRSNTGTGSVNNMFQKQFRSSNSNHICPVTVTTYITLHLDTIHKILNHILYVTLFCDIILLSSSFSISYFNQIGYSTVLCTFLLCTITILTLLIINNNHISALSILAPTQYMIGIATGITFSAIIITFLLFTTYKSTIQLCHEVMKSSATATNPSNDSYNSTSINSDGTSTGTYHHYYNDDPVLYDACKNHVSTMVSIRFWSSFIGWCNIITAALLMSGKHELSAHTTNVAQQYAYDPIASSSTPPTTTTTTGGSSGGAIGIHTTTNSTDFPPGYDFEEQFRQQQAQILGIQGVAAIQQRATAMFVGDYSTIPEVTSPSLSKNGGPQILSV